MCMEVEPVNTYRYYRYRYGVSPEWEFGWMEQQWWCVQEASIFWGGSDPLCVCGKATSFAVVSISASRINKMIHRAGTIITQSLEPFEAVRDRRSNKQQQTALHHGGPSYLPYSVLLRQESWLLLSDISKPHVGMQCDPCVSGVKPLT